MNKNQNERCPLQSECERKCQFVGTEGECDYYQGNARPGYEITELAEKAAAELRTRLEKDAADTPCGVMAEPASLQYISTSKIHPHPNNPRKELGDLSELAESIKANGVMQNLTVVRNADEYIAVIGHRRLAAAKLAGLDAVPCIVVDMSHREQVATMLLENMQRTDLTVYEQAQGFQMMIDLGETVQSVADKTGFSQTTIKRRLKMAELDQSILKDVACRQISLADFDQLAKVEDLGERNELLKSIGTANFNYRTEQHIKKQNIAKNLPAMRAQLRAAKANKISYSESYNGKYRQVNNVCFYIADWNGTDKLTPETTEKLFYYFDDNNGRLTFYTAAPKATPQRWIKAEISRAQRMKEANDAAVEIRETAYKLRKAFADGIKMTSKNTDKIFGGAISMCLVDIFSYIPSYNRSGIDCVKALGLDIDTTKAFESDDAINAAKEALGKDRAAQYPRLIYFCFGDHVENGYFNYYVSTFPRHRQNLQLDMLYDWLISLGYQMSDDEKAMRDGTHPLLHIDEAEAKA